MTTQGSITIYNKRLGEDRRDVYVPTRISAASYAEKIGSTHSDGSTSEAVTYRLRVPRGASTTDDRTFVTPAAYAALSDEQAEGHWTIQKLDLITRGEPIGTGPITEREIREAAKRAGIYVMIVEDYADNTGRGSPAVQHWRIGGR